jgi:hypothetical protein
MSTVPQIVVDWPRLLNELRHMGIRSGQIGMRVNLSSGSVREYRLGIKAPLHSNGERIIQYWSRVTGKDRSQLPMVEKVVAAATEIAQAS